MKNKEPPYTERYVWWCGRSVDKIIIYLLPDFKNKKVTKNKVKISLSFVQMFENEQKKFTNERNVKNKVS